MTINAQPVAVVGLGLMGEVFAKRLIDAGFSVTGFDIDPARRARLSALGGAAVDTIAEIAQIAQPILLAVFNTDQVEQVVEQELLPALGDRSNRIIACLSTCDPDRIAALAARVGARGIRYLDVPVSGTSEQVRQGDGVGLIAGDPEAAREVGPIFGALFRESFHVGKVGDGGRIKLAINLVLALNRLALAEGLVFAERVGVDPAAFLRVARVSAASSQVMDTKGPKMLSGDFTPEARIKQTLKDARLMLDKASAAGQKLPMLELHAQVCETCIAAGDGDLDNSVVIKAVRGYAEKS